MAEVALAASAIAIIQISRDIILGAYKYGKVVKNAKKELEKISNELEDVCEILTRLTDLAIVADKSGGQFSLWHALLSLQKEDGALSICEEALKRVRGELVPAGGIVRLTGRFRWPLKSKEVAKMLQTVVQQKVHLTELLNIHQAEHVLEIARVQQKHMDLCGLAKATAVELQEDNIMKWLSSANASGNHNAAFGQYEDNTGRWLLDSESFASWKSGVSGLAWLHGSSGCGKTVLSSAVIETIRLSLNAQTRDVMAYYYFDSRDKDKQNVGSFLRWIIGQFCRSMLSLPKTVRTMYHTYRPEIPPRQVLISTFMSLIPSAGKIYIVLDALDECSERTELFQLIHTLRRGKSTNINFFVTSQEELSIEIALKGILTHNISIRSEEVDADIKLHVCKSLTATGKLWRWFDDPVKGEIQRTLIADAEGSFRWVSCQLDTLSKHVTPSRVRQALKELPKNLNETYDRILSRIPSENYQEIRAVLYWLALSERPLSLSEVAEAAVVRPGRWLSISDRVSDPRVITDICSSLVAVTGHGGPHQGVELAHPSVKEYLLSERLRTLQHPACAFAIVDVDAHNFIWRSCISYLLHFNEPNSLTAQRFIEFPLLRYAARYWHRHVKDVDCRGPQESGGFGLMVKLFAQDSSASFLNWLRVFDLDTPWEEEQLYKRLEDFSQPLYYASRLGLLGIAKLLAENGADVNAHGGGQDANALQAAAAAGHEAVVQMLIEMGADVRAEGGSHGNALQGAAAGGHEIVVNILLDNGADANAQGGGYYGTALCAAANRGQERIVDILLVRGADVNAKGGDYGNALQMAAIGGRARVVEKLLQSGADVNAQGGIYGNALQAAVFRGGSEVVQSPHNGTTDVRPNGAYHGDSFWAETRFRDHNKVVELLLSSGADVNAQGGYYGNALQAAAAVGAMKKLQVLLDHGADINAWGGRFKTALRAAVARGHDHTVETLLNHGANIHFGEHSP